MLSGEDVLLPEFGSDVSDDTVAVFEMVVPLRTPRLTVVVIV